MLKRSVLAVAALTVAAPALVGAQGEGKPDTQEVERGRRIYQQFCAACHGQKGEGQPTWEKRNELGELPAPPHDPTGHTWKHADGMLYKTIRDGWRDPFNKTKRLTMPAFGDVLAPDEIRDVVTYLKTLWTHEQRRTQQKESQKNPFPSEVNNAGKAG